MRSWFMVNIMASVIVFPESHRARNARHQFQQTKNWREQKKDKVPIRAIIFQTARFPALRSVKPTQWIS